MNLTLKKEVKKPKEKKSWSKKEGKEKNPEPKKKNLFQRLSKESPVKTDPVETPKPEVKETPPGKSW